MDRKASRSQFFPSSWHRLLLYGLAAVGPIASAAAQLLLSIQLLHAVDLGAFGGFSFLLVAAQLSLGVSSAMFCAPYPVILSKHAEEHEGLLSTLFSANLCLSTATGIGLGLVALRFGSDTGAALAFGAYAAVMILRWFGRAYAYAHHRPMRVAVSDICYGLCLVACVIILHLTGHLGLTGAYLALFMSGFIGLLAFGPAYLLRQFIRVSLAALPRYGRIWREYTRWSLLGVVTTEATGNAHAYIVTLLGGPSAFAPIAASALLIRPVTLAMNALTDYERPQLARLMSTFGNYSKIRANIFLFRMVLLIVWIVSLAASIILLTWLPRLVFPAEYSMEVLWTGTLLWLGIALIRSVRMPESLLLQAAGEFRTLAFATVISCFASIAIVGAMVLSGMTLWSLTGILFGEAVIAYGLWKKAVSVLANLPKQNGDGS